MVERDVKWLVPYSGKNNGMPLVLSACDDGYLGYAISLIRSIDAFSPKMEFVLHLVNPSNDSIDRIRHLQRHLVYTRLAVSIEYIDLSKFERSQQQAYFASARFTWLAKFLPQINTPVFCLDADSLVVNSIESDFSDKKNAEIVLLIRNLKNDQPDHLSVAAGSIWIKPTAATCDYFSVVSQCIDERLGDNSINWFVDQDVLYKQMQLYKGKVGFYNLKTKYIDWRFKEASVVWSAKGVLKEKDMRFFLLQHILSDEPENVELAKKIWLHIKSKEGVLSKSKWLSMRFNIASQSSSKFSFVLSHHAFDFLGNIKSKLGNFMQSQKASSHNGVVAKSEKSRVALYIPRLDLPWKKINPMAKIPQITDDVIDLRLHWKKFALMLANAIERAGVNVDVIEIPGWEINRATVESSGAALAIIPHRCFIDFDDGNTPVLFYMQEYFRWVFVVNERGWSAASSQYPVVLDNVNVTTNSAFSEYRRRLVDGELASKFAQVERKDIKQLIESKGVPVVCDADNKNVLRPYIFFPLQVPTDQSIKYFSDVSEEDVVRGLCLWAKEKGIAIVLKPHPANLKSSQPFYEHVDDKNIFWSDLHVHDLISNSIAVYTINSGVGFEALLHSVPVVTFGRAEYDCVTFKSSLKAFDEAWEYCLNSSSSQLEKNYSRFLDWFLNEYALDMSLPNKLSSSLDRVAGDILNRIKKKKGDE